MLSALIALAYINLTLTGSFTQDARTPSDQDIRNFCAAVASQSITMEPSHQTAAFQYQDMVAKWGGVLPSDPEPVIHQKMRVAINTHMPRLLCNQSNFSPTNGNVLKLAIARQSDPFIEDVTYWWKVDLNQVDAVDQKTVLDYIQDKAIAAGSNDDLARTYRQLYARFRAAGAKHATELGKKAR